MLNDRVVVVTGAGGGLGRDFALAAGAAGAKVVVNDIGVAVDGTGGDEGPAAAVAEEIRSQGGEAVANTDSVATRASAGALIDCALDSFGRLDGVINNAGILRDRYFHKMSDDEWRSVIDVHLSGSFYVSRAAADVFKAQNSGAFVHITSTSGLIGQPGQANYAAAKLGIVGLSKSIALDMNRYGVRSNCIAPYAWSRMTDSIPADTPERRAKVERLQQMKGSKVAPLGVFLLSDKAADVNAQIFTVRANEIFLMSQIRPVRGIHASDGWTPETIADRLLPALRAELYPLQRSADIFSWDPV